MNVTARWDPRSNPHSASCYCELIAIKNEVR
jgi:hypothetical protein